MYKKYQHIHTEETFFMINDGVYLYKNQDTNAGYILLESTKYKTQYIMTREELDRSFKYLNEGNQKDVLMNVELEKVEIYTDGCSLTHLEKKPGGWASIVKRSNGGETLMYSGNKLDSDNNYMELLGVVETLKKFDKEYHIELYSDSKYVVDGINVYLGKRIQNNFKNIKNDDLRELWAEYHKVAGRSTVHAVWVPSSSLEELEICDKSSKKAAKELKSSEDFNSFFNS